MSLRSKWLFQVVPIGLIFGCMMILVGTLATAQVEDSTPLSPVVWEQEEERWFAITIGGSHAGWLHQVRSSDGRRYQTVQEMQIELNRAGQNMSVGSSATFIEGKDGQPIEITVVQLMGASEVKRKITFTSDGVNVVTMQGDRTHQASQPLPTGSWFMPAAMERFVDTRLKSKAKTIQYRTVDVEMGFRIIDVEMKRRLVGPDTVTIDGREIPVVAFDSKVAGVPMTSHEVYDQAGELIRSVTSLPIGDMVTQRATQEMAQTDAEQLPEIMVQTFVKPNRSIPNSLATSTARYRLKSSSDVLSTLPSAGAQYVEHGENIGWVDVVVDVFARQPATKEEQSSEEFLQSSVVVDGEDPAIKKLVATALISAGDSDLEQAEAMRRFVHEYISTKSLNTAFATASEVARSREGDCSEHAVLLAALLRSHGIPARSAAGLIYAEQFADRDDIFGWHMWTQAMIDGAWVDLDATLPGRFSASHILVGTSSLIDGSMAEDLIAMLGLMGNLEIEVVSVHYDQDPKR